MQQVDLIIIGAGPGGYEVAAEAAAKGMSVVLFEKDKLGGTCLNRGCIPTKCLCAAAERLNAVKSADCFGISVRDISFDFEIVHNRATDIVDQLRSDIESSLKNVHVVYGEAILDSDKRVKCNDKEYSASKIVIATGSRPAQLPINGAGYALSSDEVLALKSLPSNITIIGGGVIGLEFASIFCAFGCEVTVLEYCKEILPGFDRDIAKRLRSYLSRRGVKIICGAKVTSIGPDNTVAFETKGKFQNVDCDMVISAVGRQPVVPYGFEKAGIELTERGFIKVDDNFKTTSKGIFAVGDVNGRCMLAHAASAQARTAIWGTPYLENVPGVVFTNPECASVGTKLENATEGQEWKEVKLPYSANGKASASGQTDGLFKIVFDALSGRILGCHVVGAHAADLVAEIAVAIAAEMTVKNLAYGVIHAHPSISELVSSSCGIAAKMLEK